MQEQNKASAESLPTVEGPLQGQRLEGLSRVRSGGQRLSEGISEGKRGGSLFLPGAPHGGRDEAPREIQMKSHVDAEARFKLFTRCGHSTPGNEYKNQSPTCKAQQMQNQDGSVAVFFKTWDTGEIALLRNAFFSFGIRTGGQPQTKSLPFGGGRFFPPC